MVADEVTKEEAAKFIKEMQERDGFAAQSVATANIVRILFDTMENADYSDIDLEDGEADEMLSTAFDVDDF